MPWVPENDTTMSKSRCNPAKWEIGAKHPVPCQYRGLFRLRLGRRWFLSGSIPASGSIIVCALTCANRTTNEHVSTRASEYLFFEEPFTWLLQGETHLFRDPRPHTEQLSAALELHSSRITASAMLPRFTLRIASASIRTN